MRPRLVAVVFALLPGLLAAEPVTIPGDTARLRVPCADWIARRDPATMHIVLSCPQGTARRDFLTIVGLCAGVEVNRAAGTIRGRGGC